MRPPRGFFVAGAIGLALMFFGCLGTTITAALEPTATPTATWTHTATLTPTETSTGAPTASATAASLPTNTRPAPTVTVDTYLATDTATAPSAAPPLPAATTPTDTAVVVSVVDGDTIDVDWGGAIYRVRYIGMNTPESNETCGSEATRANAALVLGQTVRLEKDVSETDRFGRLLRYVYLGHLFVNAELVARGYAEAVAYPPDTAQAEYLESLEAQARAANLACYATGVFGSGVTQPTPTISPPPGGGGGYVCANNTACIKGNISSSGEKIYHFPGCQSYNQTRINESAGERWFVTSAEAGAAGWRRARNCP